MNPSIQIEITTRGHRARFPYKPNDNAIKGFHQAKMAWQKAGMSGEVYWTTPAGKLDLAKDLIAYWFTESPLGDGYNRQGKECVGVAMVDAQPMAETLPLAA